MDLLSPPDHDRQLRLVRGYPADAYPPPRAYDAGLRERFAVVLDAYRPASEGMFADVELFLQLVAALLEAVPHERVVFARPGGQTVADGPAAMAHLAAATPDEGLQPPEQIVLMEGDQPVCVVETECRVNVGDEAPFHDAYTIALYTKADRSQDFVRACERIGVEVGASLADFQDEPARREPFVPLWKRPLRWLGVKAW